MSVINKMLRDLDARRSAGTLPELQRQGGPDALQGTSSVGPGAQPSAASGWRRGLAAVLLMAGGGLGVWYLLEAEQAPAAPSPAVAPPAAAPVTPAASAPAAAASAPAASASAPLPVASAPADAAVAAASSAVPAPVSVPAVAASAPPPASTAAQQPPAKRPSAGPVTREPRVPASAAVAAKAPTPRAVEPAARAVPPAPPAAKPAPPPVLSSAATPAQRRQAAAQETLAQAQALWAAGSREAAVDLVREAALLAERSQPPDATLLALLVREQTRMELVLGRPAAVLELLTRLEPLLSSQADLWAVRGNAAQRLGRHPESVQAYLAALRLRPGEARWMLGAAVSLAAQGQLEAAAQQAERARALGPVSPEVLNYLRQAGVPLR